MNDYELKLKNHEFIGIVEDTNDPDKKQRVRIRIPYLHGTKKEIPTDALPWAHPKRSNNGFSFSIPEVNKIVMVTFPSGNAYFPVYNDAVHLNINLQKKIESYNGDDYASFMAICYNYNTQIFVDNEALNMYYKLNGIKVTNDTVLLDLKDNESMIKLGDISASQEAVLGTNFFKWMDELVKVLSNAYIGNSGVAVIPNPDLIRVLSNYGTQRKDFISKHISLVENRGVTVEQTDIDATIGDKYELVAESGVLDVKQADLTTIDTQTRQLDFEPTPPNINKKAVETADFEPLLSGDQSASGEFYEVKTPTDINDQNAVDEVNDIYGSEEPVKVFDNGSSDIYFGEGDDVLFDDTYLTEAAAANPINYGSGSIGGSNPTILSPVVFDPPLPNPATGNQKNDVNRMKKYFKSKSYQYSNLPFHMNIVGIRNTQKESGQITNQFDDYMWVFCNDDKGGLEFYKFAITTTPGFEPGTNHLPSDPVGMVTYGQYPTYRLHFHNQDTYGTSRPCLGQSENSYIRHAANANRYYTPSEYVGTEKYGGRGFNIHNSTMSGSATSVNNWSKGCQVFKNADDWRKFMSLCYRQRDKAKIDNYTYTLISQKEFSKFK